MSESFACAQALVAQLGAQGVADIVLAPGSRSAPLALAAEAAERAGLLRLHVRTDERTAGFLALGLAKPRGRCVVVITTSGTAVGNLLPAVMEAHHTGVPLLVLSADRPAALVGFGANQTTDQSRLFQGFVRYQARVASSAPSRSWTAQVARAVNLATGAATRDPGPVHLNVELAEPLVPQEILAPPVVVPVHQAVAAIAGPIVLPGGRRTILLCGDAPVEVGRMAYEVALASGTPLIAEPSSNARLGPNALATGRLLLAGDLAEQIERVVVFGHPTLSRPVTRLLGRDDVELVVVSATTDFVDPGWQASVFAGAVELAAGDPAWLDAWKEADRARSAQVAAVLAASPALTGPELARSVTSAVHAGEILVLGNSNPIRDADLAPIVDEPAPVFANRGLAGIDGTISTAIGIALDAGQATTLLCGDLTFLHDANALAIGPHEPRPALRIVVADDAGGSIFATLEYGQPRFASSFERVFATPTGTDLVALARGYGVPARRVRTRAELAESLARPIVGIEVVVVSIDRQHRRALMERLGTP